ncbi:MAG: hypothetical protein ACPF8V_01115 [Luteibaculum sp.]
MKLFYWILIWISATGISTHHPLVIFPDQVFEYPYFGPEYIQQHRIKNIRISTSKKFEGRPIYKLSQVEDLEYSKQHNLISRKIIFEALADTLETIIGWNVDHQPLRILENTGSYWEYSIIDWQQGFPKKIQIDQYPDRDASALEALVHVGSGIDQTIHWTSSTLGSQLEFELHENYGQELGRINLSPYNQPLEFAAHDIAYKKSSRYIYSYNSAGQINSVRTSGRIAFRNYVFEYNPNGSVKEIKAYQQEKLLSLTDYFYNEEGTLRSILTTRMDTKEMTIKEFRYSFY